MTKLVFNGYKRISKKAAEKLYNAGQIIRICSVKISPVNVWNFFADCQRDSLTEISSDGFNTTLARNKEFETVVNAFTFYNCNNETGRYPAYYVKM